MVTPKIKCVVALATLLLCGACASDARKDPFGITYRVDDDIEKTQQARAQQDRYLEKQVQRASRPQKVVKIPRSAQWLRTEVDTRYDMAPAHLAIANVLDGRPYRFVLSSESEKSRDESVTLPTGAQVTVKAPMRNSVNPKEISVTNPPEARTIKQHLDAIASQAGLTYSVENGVVVFTDFLVESFSVKANTLNARQAYRFSNEGANSSTSQFESNFGIYQELNGALQGLVLPPNSFSINQSANLITVRATVDVMREARRLINQINYAAARRVALRLDIYDINLSALGKRSFDFDIKELLSDSSKLEGFITDFAVQGTRQIANEEAPTSLNLRVDNPDDTLNGATALLKVLRGRGAVTKRFAKEYVVSNNQAVDEIRTRVTPYVSSVSVTTTSTGSNAVSTPSVETQEANTGTAIQIFPTISGGRVYVQMTLEESNVVRFETYQFGGEDGSSPVSGVLPVTEVSQTQHQFAMLDGETLAVAGSITSSRAHEVVNGSIIPLLGDSVDKNETRTQSLIFITANILD